MKYLRLFENYGESDVIKLYNYCKQKLSFEFEIGREYYYQNISSCVIDAVFSIGISYQQTQKAVERYNEYFKLKQFRDSEEYPMVTQQESLLQFIKNTEKVGFDQMATGIYKNRCRTSTHPNSILKSEAVYLFAKVLNKYGVNYFQDINKLLENEFFESEIRKVPGQGTGISLDYFYMLSGNENFVKVDRMMLRFIKDALGYLPNKNEIINIIREVSSKFDISPRFLDYQIWSYQRKIKL